MKHTEHIHRSRVRLMAGLFASVAMSASASALHAQASLGGYGSTTDPRVGLKAGFLDAAIASKGMDRVGHVAKADTFNIAPPGGLTFANSDLGFQGNIVVQGNFSGFMLWDVSDPSKPRLRAAYDCPTSQGDPSIYGNLLFISSESGGDRRDCSTQPAGGGRGAGGGGGGRGAGGAPAAAAGAGADSAGRAGGAGAAARGGRGGRAGGGGAAGRGGRGAGGAGAPVPPDTGKSIGIRIFDISDLDHPKHIIDVQTCRGSHTNTLIPDPLDKGVVYIYIQGQSGVRPASELAGCVGSQLDTNPNSASFRLEVIKVPLAHPEKSAIVSSPRVFHDLTRVAAHGAPEGAPAGGRGGGGGGRGGRGAPAGIDTLTPTSTAKDSMRFQKSMDSVRDLPQPGPNQCHDLTAYPAMGLAGGACGGLGLLLDIKDPAHPHRITAVGDSNFSFWHSATFSNDGSKVLFTDELGGGTAPECRAFDPMDWGGDAIFTINKLAGKLTQNAYFKMPAVQTAQENCVAHNGGLVPVPGRDIMVQGWYQGGVDVFDWTDPNHPFEIAYFDQGPIDSTRLVTGGYWCGYYYNGYIYASDIARGLDVFALKPTPQLSQNEIDAAKLVHMDRYNPQSQPKIVWPAAFPVVRSYLDQLEREKGLSASRLTALTNGVDAAEKLSGAAQRAALEKVAVTLDSDAATAKDAKRVRAMAAAARDLEKVAK